MKNKKELSEEIREGIDNSIFGQFFKGFIWAVFIVSIMLLVLGISAVGISIYKNYRCDKFGDCPLQSVIAEQSCFPLENLDCEVIDNDLTNKLNNHIEFTDEEIARIYYANHDVVVANTYICGYQEANAWFNIIKNKIGGDLSLECS